MAHVSRRLAAAVVVALLLAVPDPARADGTLFAGASLTPTTPVRGVALGLTMLVVGVELEYSVVTEDQTEARPRRQEGTASVLAQTPTGRFRVYGLAGVGLYRERVGETTLSNGTSFHVGGGLKVGLLGPVGLRLDYRISHTGGDAGSRSRQRVYAGLNVGF